MHAFAEDNRAFGYAVAASLAFHALVLFLRMPPVRESLAPPEPAAAPIEARLVEPPAAPPKVEAPPAPPLPAKKSEPPKPRPKLARPAPAPAPQAQPLPPPPSTAAVAA